MVDPLEFALVGATAFVAALISSMAGAGLTPVLLPVLVLFEGIHEAMPIATFALLTAGVSRVVVNRREIVYPVAGWFLAGALPLVVAGTYLFTVAPPALLTRLLGLMLLLTLVWRRWHPAPPRRRAAAWFLPLGTGFGFLSGITAGTGPLMAPFFLGYGLRKGRYVGTAGLIVLGLQSTKLAVFGQADFLTPRVTVFGLGLLPLVVLGTLAGKWLMNRLSERRFEHVIEVVMLAAGLAFLIRG